MKPILYSTQIRRSLSHSQSHWANVPLAPPDKILGLTEAFKADTFAQKINLGVGAYRNDKGAPYVLPSVRDAEQRITSRKMDKEYAPIAGVGDFIKHALTFAYGKDSKPILENRVAAVQAISGTGACRLSGEFLRRFIGPHRIHVPTPTWGNHIPIFENAGLKPTYYPYYDSAHNRVDMHHLLEYANKQDHSEIFLLHACAHNPTGSDPTKEEWRELSALFRKKKHIALFDSAYQGFASGDPEADAFSLRQFVADGHQILLCQSFAKNFGLYGERVGLFSVVTDSPAEAERVNSQLKVIVRPMYSNPPIHGARIVSEVLGDPQLRGQWLEECRHMAERIQRMRTLLRAKLEAGDPQRCWKHLTDQIGMFCFTGMTKEQVLRLRAEFHIYCTDDGRFSVAGINEGNIDYLAQSVLAVTKPVATQNKHGHAHGHSHAHKH